MELISLSIISVSHGLLNTIVSASNVRWILERGAGGQGGRKLENNEDQKKISPLRITPFSSPKLGKDQTKVFHSKLVRFLAQNWVKTNKITGLYPNSVLLCAQTFCPSYNGGRPCRNFAYYSMLIILSWRPKGRHVTMNPPKYAPGVSVLHFFFNKKQ